MKRVFSARLVAVAVLVVALGLLAGVAWAAAPGSASSQQQSNRFAEATAYSNTSTKGGILLRPGLVFDGARVSVTVDGSGFVTPGAVFIELVTDVSKPAGIIGGAIVNEAGAFTVSANMAFTGQAGKVYTVQVTASDGTVVTTPLQVVKDK